MLRKSAKFFEYLSGLLTCTFRVTGSLPHQLTYQITWVQCLSFGHVNCSRIPRDSLALWDPRRCEVFEIHDTITLKVIWRKSLPGTRKVPPSTRDQTFENWLIWKSNQTIQHLLHIIICWVKVFEIKLSPNKLLNHVSQCFTNARTFELRFIPYDTYCTPFFVLAIIP